MSVTQLMIDCLVNARQEQGITQTALAEKLGVTQPCISFWEWGRTEPSPSKLARWAEALGVELRS